ncbi:MAG: 3-keto-disaccharide hydrolase [Planctomycetota bacterium]|jgi:hypothetical protein
MPEIPSRIVATTFPQRATDADGFTSIFDGKTLSGWRAVPRESASDWSVRNGAIVGLGSTNRLSYLVGSDNNLTDFELKLSYRLRTEGNSGVEIRSRLDVTRKRPFEGYHADLGHVGIGPQILGAWDFHFAKRKEYPCDRGMRLVIDADGKPHHSRISGALTAADVRKGQWNEIHIIARGRQCQFLINGKIASKFIDNVEPERLKRGAIGLQIHDKGTKVEFKDIRLKRTEELKVEIEQITHGPRHHFFGYIGQSLTIPWNSSGRYIVALRTDFHDRMPKAGEAADVVLVDTTQRNRVLPIEKCRAWNFQQGTMFYWNPKKPETQFFFNDRDPQTGRVFTVLYDVEKRERVREFRYEDASFGNGGVAQGGGAFLGLNYGRMARLRPVTGYPGALDWTQGVNAPTDDGIFKVDTETGEKRVLVSFRQLADLLRPRHPNIDDIPLFINHTLWNRDDSRIYFYARGNWGRPGPSINVPCTVKSDGTGLTMHDTFIGGHPEWGEGNQVIGSRDDQQVLYDVDRKEIVGQIGTREVLPKPGGDVSYSPDGKWFVNGYKDGSKNYYVIIRLSDGAHVRTPGIDKGSYSDDLRIDPAPRWNRSSDAILVPGITANGTRQLHLVRVVEKQ